MQDVVLREYDGECFQNGTQRSEEPELWIQYESWHLMCSARHVHATAFVGSKKPCTPQVVNLKISRHMGSKGSTVDHERTRTVYTSIFFRVRKGKSRRLIYAGGCEQTQR